VEFCFDPLYWPMHDCYSITYPNGSAFHAWRAGFREGVKMCLNRGAKPTAIEFKDSVHKRNMDHLSIWQNVGSDAEYGNYAILGARMGTFRTMLQDWDHTEVQWFNNLQQIWENEVANIPADQITNASLQIGEALSNQLDLPMVYLKSKESEFFKQHYMNTWKNKGPTVKENE